MPNMEGNKYRFLRPMATISKRTQNTNKKLTR